MEVSVDLDESLARELAEEAEIHGFESREAYLRWILVHRPSSEPSAQRQPTLASRLSTLEERVTVVERHLGFDGSADPDADLASSGDPSPGGGDLGEEGGTGGGVSLSGTVEPDDREDSGDDAAADDDVAAAIDSISLEEENED